MKAVIVLFMAMSSQSLTVCSVEPEMLRYHEVTGGQFSRFVREEGREGRELLSIEKPPKIGAGVRLGN